MTANTRLREKIFRFIIPYGTTFIYTVYCWNVITWHMTVAIVESFNDMVVLVLILEEPPYYSPSWLHQFTFPPTLHRSPFSSTFSPALSISCPLDNSHSSHSNKYEAMSYCSFDLHFSVDMRYQTSSCMYLLAVCISSFLNWIVCGLVLFVCFCVCVVVVVFTIDLYEFLIYFRYQFLSNTWFATAIDSEAFSDLVWIYLFCTRTVLWKNSLTYLSFFYFITHQVGCSQSLFFHWRCLYSPSLWFLLCPSTLACFLHMLPTSTCAPCCPPNQAQGTSHKEGRGVGLARDVLDVPAGQLGGSLGQDAS